MEDNNFAHFGSLPKNFGYDEYDGDFSKLIPEDRQIVLLMGYRQSGKTSVAKVLFQKYTPEDTFSFEPTTEITKHELLTPSVVLNFDLIECPDNCLLPDGQLSPAMMDRTNALFKQCSAIVFLIDSQAVGDINSLTFYIASTIRRAYLLNERINFEIFVHKVDGLVDEQKMLISRNIRSCLLEFLKEHGMAGCNTRYFLTSIHDHSIYESFSKVVQKLFVNVHVLEKLLDIFVKHSCVDKAFLFDVGSKVYIATDGTAVDHLQYELCCDMIDVVLAVSGIYCPADDVFDHMSSGVIKLKNQTCLYLREVYHNLALACVMRQECLDKQGIIDYNFLCLRNGVQEVFNLMPHASSGSSSSAGTAGRPAPGRDMRAKGSSASGGSSAAAMAAPGIPAGQAGRLAVIDELTPGSHGSSTLDPADAEPSQRAALSLVPPVVVNGNADPAKRSRELLT